MFDYEIKVQHWVNRTGFALRSQVQKAFEVAQIDLSVEEWSLLMILWRDGPQTMQVLASKTTRNRTTVTRLIDRLFRKALVQRERSETDRRYMQIGVTDKGQALQAPVVLEIEAMMARSAQGISQADQDITVKVLQKMAENLAP